MSTSSLVSRIVLAALFAAMIAGSTQLLAQSPPSDAALPIGQLSVAGAPAVPIYAFSSGVSNPVSGPGGGAGAAILSDIAVGKLADAQSTALFSAIVRGQHIPSVRIELYENGKVAAIYELGDVVVTSFVSGNTGESVAFNFARLTFTVAGQTFCWDKATNSSC